jgi:succinate dehydrogenase / fumarate reductase cytochrome b subunit
MLVAGFGHPGTAAAYAAGLLALLLHLIHGIASSVQTLGLNGPRSFPWLERGALLLALLLVTAFAAIPAGILAGAVRWP